MAVLAHSRMATSDHRHQAHRSTLIQKSRHQPGDASMA